MYVCMYEQTNQIDKSILHVKFNCHIESNTAHKHLLYVTESKRPSFEMYIT